MLRTLALITALLLPPVAAAAVTFEDAIIQQLNEQGFVSIEISRTLLGRVRIVAYTDAMRREIVFNPSTGEILRDYWEMLDASGTKYVPMYGRPELPSSGDDDEDDGDDDEDDDDDDEDDDEDDDDDDDDDDDEPEE